MCIVAASQPATAVVQDSSPAAMRPAAAQHGFSRQRHATAAAAATTSAAAVTVDTVRELEAVRDALRAHSFSPRGAQAKTELIERAIRLFHGASWSSGTGSFSGAQLVSFAAQPELLKALRAQLLDKASAVRAAALRALRHMLLSDDVMRGVSSLRLPHLIAARAEAAVCVWERVCAMKFMTHWAALVADGRSEEPVPRIFVHAFISIAEHAGDQLQTAALRALCDVALAFPRLVVECDGFACLAEALVDPAHAALAPSLVATILHALDDPGVRPRLAHCLDCLFTVFSSAVSENPPVSKEARDARADRWAASRRALLLMLRSTTGLFALSANNQGLPSLCQLLCQPVEAEVKGALLELFAGILDRFCLRVVASRAESRSCYAVPPTCGSQFTGLLGARRDRAESFSSEAFLDTAFDTAAGATSRRGSFSRTCASGDQLHFTAETLDECEVEPAVGALDAATEEATPCTRRSVRAESGFYATLHRGDQEADFVEVFAGLVLRHLLESGLPQSLSEMCVCMATEGDGTEYEVVRFGATLLAELSLAASVLLPTTSSAQIQEAMRPIADAALAFNGDLRQRSRADELLAGLAEAGVVSGTGGLGLFGLGPAGSNAVGSAGPGCGGGGAGGGAGSGVGAVGAGMLLGTAAEEERLLRVNSSFGAILQRGPSAADASASASCLETDPGVRQSMFGGLLSPRWAGAEARHSGSIADSVGTPVGSARGGGGAGVAESSTAAAAPPGATAMRSRTGSGADVAVGAAGGTSTAGGASATGSAAAPVNGGAGTGELVSAQAGASAGPGAWVGAGVAAAAAAAVAAVAAGTGAGACSGGNSFDSVGSGGGDGWGSGRWGEEATGVQKQRVRLALALDFAYAASGEVSHRRLLRHVQKSLRGPTLARKDAGLPDDVQALLRQTGVLGLSKDSSKWDWLSVREVVAGLLQDPSRIDGILSTKFFKRLLRFFSPNHTDGLGALDWLPENLPLARVGLVLLGLLLNHEAARHQLLATSDSLLKRHSFPVYLAAMLTRELNDGRPPALSALPSTASRLSLLLSPSQKSVGVVLLGRNSGSAHRPTSDRGSKEDERGVTGGRRGSRQRGGGGRSVSDPPESRVQHRSRSNRGHASGSPRPAAAAAGERGPRSGDTERSSDGEEASCRGALSLDSSQEFANAVGAGANSGTVTKAQQLSVRPDRPLATPEQAGQSLAREYASFVGLLSASPEGIAILARAGIYQTLKEMCAVPSKDYLSCLLLPQLHYGFSQNRQVLDEALRVGSLVLQLALVRFLALMLCSGSLAPRPPVSLLVGVNRERDGALAARVGRRYRSNPAESIPMDMSPLSFSSASGLEQCRGLSFMLGSSAGVTPPGTPPVELRDVSDSGSFVQGGAAGAAADHSDAAAQAHPAPAATATAVPTTPSAMSLWVSSAAVTASVLDTCASMSAALAFVEAQEEQQAAQAQTASAGDHLLQSVVEDAGATDSERWSWIVGLLASLVTHSESRVARVAIAALHEACQSEEGSLSLLSNWPSASELQAQWPPCLRLLLLQTEPGFEALQQSGWLDKDADLWWSRDHRRYSALVTASLSVAFGGEEETQQLALSQQGEDRSSPRRSPCRGRKVPLTEIPVDAPQRLDESWPQYSWLCSVPWRPTLRIERTEAPGKLQPSPSSQPVVEELALHAVVERVVPHEVQCHLGQGFPQSKGEFASLGAATEFRVTAWCDVPLGANAPTTLHAMLDVGKLNIQEASSVFDSANDWSLARCMERSADGFGYEFCRSTSCAVWSFLVSGRGGQAVATSNQATSKDPSTLSFAERRARFEKAPPPSNCRLVAVSWRLRLPGVHPAWVRPPLHFCSLAACTPLGVDFLRRHSVVRDRIALVLGRALRGPQAQAAKQAEVSPPTTAEVRAALWAAGHLGRTPLGLELLSECGVLELLVELATNAGRWSLRGTATYALALVGLNASAVELLEELGWDARHHGPSTRRGNLSRQVSSPMASNQPRGHRQHGEPGNGAASPVVHAHRPSASGSDLRDPPHGPLDVSAVRDEGSRGAHAAFGDAHREVLERLWSLHNTLARKKACEALTEERRRRPAVFLSAGLWWLTQHRILSRYRHPLPVRRFIADLFEDTLSSSEALQWLDTLPR